MKRILAMLAVLLVAGVASAQTGEIGSGLPNAGEPGYSADFDEFDIAGTYKLGNSLTSISYNFTHGGNGFIGALWDCDTLTQSAATCDLITALTVAGESGTATTKHRVLLVVISTPEGSGTMSTLTVKGGYDIGLGGGSGSGGITGWPTLENLGGTGRPTQALFVSSFMFAMHNSGLGRDVNGSIWDAGCTLGPDAADDLPCLTVAATKANMLIDITATSAVGATAITMDGSQTGFESFCRHDTTFLHGKGSASYDPIATTQSRPIPIVIRDDDGNAATADVYRLAPIDMGGSVASICQLDDTTASAGTRLELLYPTALTDDVMIFSPDGFSRSPYGSYFIAQSVLETTFEQQYPEVLGLTNLITNGYQETDCTGGADVTISGAGAVIDILAGWTNGKPFQSQLIGRGCQISGAATGDTITWAVSAADSGEYYVGQIYISGNELGVLARNVRLRIQDQGGAVLPAADVQWWMEGPAVGHKEKIEEIDASAIVGDELHLAERACQGGCLVSFAFRLANDDTGFSLRLQDQNATPTFMSYDEVWARRKVYRDLEEHPIIMDGRASITLITDGLEVAGVEDIADGFDHVLGYATTYETSTTKVSIRPDLYLSKQPSQSVIELDGGLLSNVVGDWDGNADLADDAITSRLKDRITGTHYCILMMGNYDPIAAHASGAGSRPSSSALASDSVANRYLYFQDQIRGFEQAAESKACMPIVVLPYPQRAVTSQSYCATAAGAADNCGDWWTEMNKNVLHNGPS